MSLGLILFASCFPLESFRQAMLAYGIHWGVACGTAGLHGDTGHFWLANMSDEGFVLMQDATGGGGSDALADPAANDALRAQLGLKPLRR